MPAGAWSRDLWRQTESDFVTPLRVHAPASLAELFADLGGGRGRQGLGADVLSAAELTAPCCVRKWLATESPEITQRVEWRK
jgi:hypothetical protein